MVPPLKESMIIPLLVLSLRGQEHFPFPSSPMIGVSPIHGYAFGRKRLIYHFIKSEGSNRTLLIKSVL